MLTRGEYPGKIMPNRLTQVLATRLRHLRVKQLTLLNSGWTDCSGGRELGQLGHKLQLPACHAEAQEAEMSSAEVLTVGAQASVESDLQATRRSYDGASWHTGKLSVHAKHIRTGLRHPELAFVQEGRVEKAESG